MTKENFLDKWIEALPLNSKDADRKEMAYDIDLMLQKQSLSIVNAVGRSEQLKCPHCGDTENIFDWHTYKRCKTCTTEF